MLPISRCAWWISEDDRSTFAEKKSPYGCTYVGDEMLVLNKQRVNEKKKTDKKSSIKDSSIKKLSASNVNFLKSLGFVVRK